MSSRRGARPATEERFDELWRDHAPAVVRYLRRRVAPQDVEDAVAETFVVAWRRLDEVPDYALPWLLAVARRTASNSVRAARRRDALEGRAARESRNAIDQSAPTASGATEAVLAALDTLSPGDRELLTLIAWDGLTHEQAAEALECGRGALAVRLHRARRRLKTALVAPATDPDPGLSAAAHAHPFLRVEPRTVPHELS